MLVAQFAQASNTLLEAWRRAAMHFEQTLRDQIKDEAQALLQLSAIGDLLEDTLAQADDILKACSRFSTTSLAPTSKAVPSSRPVPSSCPKAPPVRDPIVKSQGLQYKHDQLAPVPTSVKRPRSTVQDLVAELDHTRLETQQQAETRILEHLQQVERFFESLPIEHTSEERALRSALLTFLDGWTKSDPPRIDQACDASAGGHSGPSEVGLARKACLPKGVGLAQWIEKRMGTELEVATQRRAYGEKLGTGVSYFHYIGCLVIPDMKSPVPAQCPKCCGTGTAGPRNGKCFKCGGEGLIGHKSTSEINPGMHEKKKKREEHGASRF